MPKKVSKSEPRAADGDRAVLKALAKETKELRDLCQLRALKMARGQKEEVARLRQGIAENRLQLKNLTIQAEECHGAYETLMDAFRTMNLADSHLEP